MGQFGYTGLSFPLLTGISQVSGVPATGMPNGEVLGGQSLTSNGVTFAMIDQGTTANVWGASNQAGVTTFTIPMGIFGVTNTWTMLNDEWGTSGNDTNVTFNFSSGSVTFNLINGVQIRDSVDCTGGTGLAACTARGFQTSLDTSNAYATNGTSAAVAGNPAVSAFNVWTGAYTGSPTGGAYANTTGSLFLDAQKFSFLGTPFSAGNVELLSVVITDQNPGGFGSRDGLSAITVLGQTPEPSTVLLFAAGLAAVGFIRFRRKSVI